MADKLKNLMGLLPVKYQLTLATVPGSGLSVPPGMNSVAALAPTANTWLEVVNVTGAGRLKGVVLTTPAPAGTSYIMRLRVTLDGVAYDAQVALGAAGYAYIYLAEMAVGSDLALLAERRFSQSLKIEVRRDSAAVPAMTLLYTYELEVV